MRERRNLNPRNHALNARQSDNLSLLFERTMKLQEESGIDLTLVGSGSGFRSISDHHAIYKTINDKRIKQGLPPIKIPLGSKHLSGEAADFWDGARKLQAWILANEDKCAEIGLWFEHFDYTKTWVHAQIVAPRSKERFFKPF